MSKYEDFIDAVRESKPVNPGRGKEIDKILEKTSPGNLVRSGRKSGIFIIFENSAVRSFLAAASVVIISIFSWQQFTIMSKMNRLEERMMEVNTDKILESFRQNVKVKTMISGEEDFSPAMTDSIKVAGKDLQELIKSYSELQRRYEELQKWVQSGKSDGKDDKLKI